MVPAVSVPVTATLTVWGEVHPDGSVTEPDMPAPVSLIVHVGVGERFVVIVIATVLSSTNLKSSIVMSPLYITNEVP